MSEKKNNSGFGDRAQEMLMLDMLDGMHEFFTQTAYHSSLANSFKILPKEGEQGESVRNTAHSQDDRAVVISFSEARARRVTLQDNLNKKAATTRS